ncbi:MAG: outer membrane protein transport protein [Candidatus Omnitrophota bacterium]
MSRIFRFVALLVLVFILVIFLLPNQTLFAAGFNVVEHGTRSMGRGGAFVATADDGSSFYYNPAGLTQIEGGLFQEDLIFIFRNTKYVATSGVEEKMNLIAHHANTYFVVANKSDKVKYGLGIFTPFGSFTEWSEYGPLRYMATYSEMKMTNYNPSLGVKINPHLSYGLGLDIYESSMKSKKMVNYVISDAHYTLESRKAYALGYNLGVLYKLDEKRRLGVSYRSRFSMLYKGQGVISEIPTGPNLKSSVLAKYSFPDEFMVGYAQRIKGKWDVEADLQWTNWSQYKHVSVEFSDRPSWNTFSPKNWRDGFIYKLGLEYFMNDRVSLRAGYAYSTSPVPSSSFEPSTPDACRQTLYLGYGYKKNSFSANIANAFTIFRDRFVDNNVGSSSGTTIDGRYDTIVSQISLSLSWSF